MRLVPQSSPYIRKGVSVKRMMLDVVIALLPVTLFAMIVNGWNGIYVFLISIVAMLLAEIVAHAIIKWPKGMKFKELFKKEGFLKVKETFTINNILAPLISALIYALILPAGCDWYVVLVGALFGIIIGKMVFGGLGSNIFNPAAVGRVFVGLCFGTRVSAAYANSPYYVTGVTNTIDATVTSGTPLAFVNGGNVTNTSFYGLKSMLIGQIPGCMGEVCTLLIIVGGIYLFVRRSADIRAFLGYIVTFGIISAIVAVSALKKYPDSSFIRTFAYQMLSGGVFFGAVFMITDPVTSPTTKFGRVFFASFAACLTALIRICGSMPEGVAFSILLANMMAPVLDYFMRGKPNTYTWKQCLILAGMIVAVCAIISATVMGGWF